jgi:hypothetical protein
VWLRLCEDTLIKFADLVDPKVIDSTVFASPRLDYPT